MKNDVKKEVRILQASAYTLVGWTFEAVVCYNRGCVCAGCINAELETECRMKSTVLRLVREFGVPKGIPGGCKTRLKCDNHLCNSKEQCAKYRRTNNKGVSND